MYMEELAGVITDLSDAAREISNGKQTILELDSRMWLLSNALWYLTLGIYDRKFTDKEGLSDKAITLAKRTVEDLKKELETGV